MKNRVILSGLLLLASMGVGSAFAGPGVQVGSGSGPSGSGTPVDITVDFEAGGGTVGGQFKILYDDANLTPDLTNGCTSANWACSVQSPGVLQYVSNVVVAGLPTEQIGTIAFDISAAAVDTYPLTVSEELYGDAGENPVAPDGTVNGQITVSAGPQPAYSSNPVPGALNVGSVVQNDTDIAANVAISNTGDSGTTLTGMCTETSDPDNVFSLSGDTSFSVLQGGPADTVTVTCDSAGSIAVHTGTMECSHNGDNIASPAVYNLSCTITAGPQPAYASNPAPGTPINFGPTEEGDPDPATALSITNSGDPGTTLTGTCGVTGDPQISVVDGAFSVMQGAGADVQTISCDASAEGNYSATVSCTHNGSNASPAEYAVTCEITPPGEAVFASTPAPGAIDMTPGDDPPAGGTNPTTVLTFFNNADPGDQDLGIGCTLAGDAEITVAPDISGGITIGPGSSSFVTFTCNAANVGNFAATYTCPYDTDGVAGDDGNAVYNVTCDVRDAEADVDPSPADGTPLMGLADPGGTFQFNVTFTEVNDEGIDGEVSCSLADGTNFEITSPVGFPTPVTVPAGGSVVVTVTGTAPDDGSTSVSDTLNCTYSDSSSEGIEVSYPLTLQIGGGGLFEVTKAFTEGYDGEVTVTLTCDTGLPLIQTFDISPDRPVFFVVTEFESGAMNCSVTEGTGSGFNPTYLASGDSQSDDDDSQAPGCHFFAVAGGDSNTCNITNAPAPVDVVIEKEWVIAGAVGEEVNDFFGLTLYCDGEIVGGSTNNAPAGAGTQGGIIIVPSAWYQNFEGVGDSTFTAQVVPSFPTTNCWVEENVFGSGIEVDNGCTGIEVSLNQGDSCTITNTVFFEGIPTLSQWGLVIMALLMLGVGLVGFRRFA